MAQNDGGLLDEGGDASDWIELRNTSNATVDVTGWGLSDNSAQPMKWIFPAYGGGSNYPSGVYYYKLSTVEFSETKKMVLIK